MAIASHSGPAGVCRGFSCPSIRGHKPLRHSRKTSHYNAKGHTACQADTWCVGGAWMSGGCHFHISKGGTGRTRNTTKGRRGYGYFPMRRQILEAFVMCVSCFSSWFSCWMWRWWFHSAGKRYWQCNRNFGFSTTRNVINAFIHASHPVTFQCPNTSP